MVKQKKETKHDLTKEIVQEKIKGENFEFTLRIGDIIDKNIEAFQLLNNKTLPVNYTEKFYKVLVFKKKKKYFIHFYQKLKGCN